MDAKAKFEKEREKTLKELPDTIKNMFGEIGFARHSPEDYEEVNDNAVDTFVPVLVMNPYDVPPKPVRDVYWFSNFMAAKRKKQLDKLAYLVYRYGYDDPDDCFCFLEQEDFISYDVGKEKGYDDVTAIATHEGFLTEEERIIRVRGLQELHEDIGKAPADRRRGVNFQERHEIVKDPPSRPPAKRQRKN